MASNSLTAILGITHPIIQAPMAGVSTPAMAADASNAGALGSLPLAMANVTQARDLLAQTRALTDKPFNVNFFCHTPPQRDADKEAAWAAHLAPYFAEFGATLATPLKELNTSFAVDTAMQSLILEARPAVVSFHFGLPPQNVIDALKRAGCFLMASATNLDEARRIEAARLDAIIAQGIESGGHRGVFDAHAVDAAIGTLALVRLVVADTRLPVIAAGGIMDGQGIAAALMLGASAAQLGTAFLLTPQSNASAAYRAMLTSQRAETTQLTRTISGRSARGMRNRFMHDIDVVNAPIPPDYPITYDAGKQLHAAASAAGCHEFGACWAGQGAALVREMETSALIAVLADELQQARRQFT